ELRGLPVPWNRRQRKGEPAHDSQGMHGLLMRAEPSGRRTWAVRSRAIPLKYLSRTGNSVQDGGSVVHGPEERARRTCRTDRANCLDRDAADERFDRLVERGVLLDERLDACDGVKHGGVIL